MGWFGTKVSFKSVRRECVEARLRAARSYNNSRFIEIAKEFSPLLEFLA